MYPTHTIVSLADVHFGALEPQYCYNNLQTQFIQRIANINFDILAICGDLFDAKFMSNNPIISFAIAFISDVVNLCRAKNATLAIIDGTSGHDNGQLSLFYHYLSDPTIDIRIVEDIRFEEIQGMRVLCIPERYGVPEETYKNFLYHSGGYDMCFMHGTFKGSFKGSEIATLKSNHAPVFSMNNFINCGGPILMGHYHISGCYGGYAYYHGSTFRYQFGEEAPKGFLITIFDQLTRHHYTQLIPVESYSYITINIDDIIGNDPKTIIDYIKTYKETYGIDYIRIQYSKSSENMAIVRNYFRNNSQVVLDDIGKKDRQIAKFDQQINEQSSQYPYMTDNNIDDYTKYVMYVNQCEGTEFITVEGLIALLEKFK